jgi:hypothetical protein
MLQSVLQHVVHVFLTCSDQFTWQAYNMFAWWLGAYASSPRSFNSH